MTRCQKFTARQVHAGIARLQDGLETHPQHRLASHVSRMCAASSTVSRDTQPSGSTTIARAGSEPKRNSSPPKFPGGMQSRQLRGSPTQDTPCSSLTSTPQKSGRQGLAPKEAPGYVVRAGPGRAAGLPLRVHRSPGPVVEERLHKRIPQKHGRILHCPGVHSET